MTNEQKREEKQKLLLERLQEMSYLDDEGNQYYIG